jgi:hypothetical protein
MKVRYFTAPPRVCIYTTNELKPDRHAETIELIRLYSAALHPGSMRASEPCLSILSLAHRRCDPRSIEPIVRRTEYNHWVVPPFQSTPDTSTIYQVGAVAGPRVHLHNWGIEPAVCSRHMPRKTYIQTSRCELLSSRAQDHHRSIRSWVLVEAW